MTSDALFATVLLFLLFLSAGILSYLIIRGAGKGWRKDDD